jgi:hypothetical protein
MGDCVYETNNDIMRAGTYTQLFTFLCPLVYPEGKSVSRLVRENVGLDTCCFCCFSTDRIRMTQNTYLLRGVCLSHAVAPETDL